MTEHDRELGALSQKVAALTDDIEEVKDDVKELKVDMKRVLAYMDREEGGRVARDKMQAKWYQETGSAAANQHFQIELTWTKIMAMAAVVGSLTGLIALAPHFIFHVG